AHVLYGRTRALSPTDWGSAGDLNGIYFYSDTAAGNWWAAANVGQNDLVPPGTYRTSAMGGFPGATGTITNMNAAFNNTEPNGTWYVRFTDSCRLDVGIVSGLNITLSTTGITAPPISATPDAYFAGRSTPLVVAAPGVLANDINSPGSGPLSAVLQSLPTHGTLTLNANGGFTYIPTAGYLGPDSFMYYPTNPFGSAAPTTVSITVVPVQPATNLRVDRVSGNVVTLRWNAPPYGPPPTSYVIEGGVLPGQTLASIPTTAAPVMTFVAPTGSFYARIKSIDGSMVSDVSNEVRLHVNVPVPPSAPSSFTGVVNESSLGLSWKLTYEGGEPTNVILDVSGAIATSIPIGASETFSFAGVPPGTYTLALRAANAAGVSAASAPITLTFPTACSGLPAAPSNFVFYRTGNVANVIWDPPTNGAAATAYVLNVSGMFNGQLPVGGSRSLSTPVAPGSYTVSVIAVNACGASVPTAAQTVVFP
ncbi:MAG: cadherin-like domain-containing protein, partial [Acidobacteria bacterium]|nr:cadherin-like domain-containing protein [Acidobacteriota bacterium]